MMMWRTTCGGLTLMRTKVRSVTSNIRVTTYMLVMGRSGSARKPDMHRPVTCGAYVFAESEGDDGAAADVDSWMPRYPAALQCKDDPQDPTRILVPYCMRYESSGPNQAQRLRDHHASATPTAAGAPPAQRTHQGGRPSQGPRPRRAAGAPCRGQPGRPYSM